MFCAFLDTTSLFLAALTLVSAPVSAALQNATIDDQDLSKISYINPLDWSHDPLIGWEYQFYNGSRSYTWIPGASASLTFTGSGVYLQGPPAPDQAQRRVFLDGRDMGAFNLKGDTREFCRVFFSATQLPYTTHTIVVAHNDTPAMIFAMDAWFVEFDDTQSILPFTTTTTTQTAPTQTITTLPTVSNGIHINGTISGSPNTPDQNAANPKSYSTIIIAIVVPVLLFLLFLLIGGCYLYRKRRTRSAQRRRRESFSPLTPAFRNQGTGLVAIGAGAAGGRDSNDSRAMSPHTFASTRYSTALDHEYNSDQDHSRSELSPASPMIIAPTNILDPLILSAAMNGGGGGRNSGSSTSLIGLNSNTTPIRPTFDPPAEWRTTLSSSSGPDVPPANANAHSFSHGHSSEAHTHANPTDLLTASGTAIAAGRAARSSPDAYYRGLASNPKPGPVPSTVVSETESAYSLGLGAPPARHYQLQDVRASTPTARDAEYGNEFGSPPASPTTGTPNRSNSVLKRFSTALTSTLPFARVGSRPNPRHSNSHTMSTTNTNTNTNTGGNGNRDGVGAAGTRNSEDAENGAAGRGYFRGMNHFNLGIPLNYRPAATANNPRAPSPAAASTRVGRQSQNLTDRGFDDIWLGTRPSGGGGVPSNGETTRPTTAPTTPGNALVQSPFDDVAFSSYTRQTRERVLSYPTAGEADGVGAASAAGARSTPPAPPVSSLDSSEAADDKEPEEKEEKIFETLDGETMRGEGEDEGRWSVGHGTLASNGGISVGAADGGVTRTGSLGRQRSVRSTADQGRGVIPPPYSLYIPPDTKTSPPPPGSQ